MCSIIMIEEGMSVDDAINFWQEQGAKESVSESLKESLALND